MIPMSEDRSESRVGEYTCQEVPSKRKENSKSCHIPNLILSLSFPEALKPGLTILVFERCTQGTKGQAIWLGGKSVHILGTYFGDFCV